MNKNLLVIGAGPKALALHARAVALRTLGRDAPTVIILEQNMVGANWAGQHGFTDGERQLVTSPERDIGYPYLSADPEVDAELTRYSWQSFLVSRRGFAAWIDANRPYP